MRVGIASMGKMGAAIAARLHETGMEVLVCNRTRYKAEATGLPVAATLHDLCARSEVIITTVFDDLAAEEIYRDPAGPLAVGRPT